ASHFCDSQEQLSLPGLDEAIASLRQVMGDAAFEDAWQSGATMPIDTVIDHVVGESPLPSLARNAP
ncbi:MAG TPA: hypothetical protein VK356_08235, partial [Thermomicrobiales bacterium]|nr:hypothetical protein [Thermomicrobiales bacterium]